MGAMQAMQPERRAELRPIELTAGRSRIRVTHPAAVPAFRPALSEEAAAVVTAERIGLGAEKAEALALARRLNAYWAQYGHDAGALAVPILGGAHGQTVTGWRVETRGLVNGAPVRRAPFGAPRARGMP